ncbi:hypothetical protein [Vibrio gallicus]|uniref:hypothetical protein n=1 Tax=Vibrio gallicus TaxID=190897 RepID=UPI0021C3D57A|nr:hypothetical protein [Vibrio gallicus]
MLIRSECEKLGFPAPLETERQQEYLVRLMLEGIALNTRQARVIGIGNLHSLVSTIKKQGIWHSIEHKKAMCPKTRIVPPFLVVHVFMTMEQREAYIDDKIRKQELAEELKEKRAQVLTQAL